MKEVAASQKGLTVHGGGATVNFLAIPAEARRAITVVGPRPETAGSGWAVAGMAVGMALGGPVGAALGGWVGNAISKGETPGACAFTVQDVPDAHFPPGHPEIGGAYLRHPIDMRRYIPVTDYSSTIFAEKRRELKALLQALGARTVSISTLDGRRRASSARLGLNTPTNAGQLGVSAADQRRSVNTEATKEITKSIPTREPHVPEGLLWYPHEPEWQSLAKGRLELGTRVVTCRVSKRSLEEISAELNIGLESLGVSLEGTSGEQTEETVEFHADFREPRLTQTPALLAGVVVIIAIVIALVVGLFQ